MKQLLNKSLKEMKNNLFLVCLLKEGCSEEVWLKFFTERFLIRETFPLLLKNGFERAFATGDQIVGNVLKSNYDEEYGLDNLGNQTSVVHSEEAREFYRELGVTDEMVEIAKVHQFPGTHYYKFMVNRLIEPNTHYLKISGALWYIEFTLSAELHLMKRIILKKIPGLSQRSLSYLDDHIRHDAQDHAPKLKEALLNKKELEHLILEGFTDIKNAKDNFYKKCLSLLQ